MSRFSDHIESLRAKAAASSSAASGVFSRTTILLEGGRARVPGTARSADPFTPGDVAAALKAIETLAPKPSGFGLHVLRVVAGAPFARYHALPWQPLARPQDWIPAARVQSLQTGAGSETSRFAATDGNWRCGRLAAAMPEALCSGIGKMCKARRLMLGGIEPGYTFALQRHAARIRDGSIAIVALETVDDGATVAQIGLRNGGGWTGFITLPLAGTLDDVLRDAFALCADTPPARRYVIGPGDGTRWSAQAAGIEWLRAPWDDAP
ncbi:hypothetical protein P9239_14680 [Caballeronia sp. LZ062]|uniref:hypothetical protein n=1 Tax=unclassified Caballeronia TaxID=2646786 RepID=UPI00285A133F|nr:MULTISPECIES: hypothetical protein [unclassified Caballeronia]MDR5853882.1 hypothetical protein [Caballeronia sp. LZ050]MDR5871587.1 hypothetical protein [Caballeronia sp. LZ062]